MTLRHTTKAVLRRGDTHYVAGCLEIPVVTQGRTLDETMANLREAVALHLEGEDLSELGLAPQDCRFISAEKLHREFYSDWGEC